MHSTSPPLALVGSDLHARAERLRRRAARRAHATLTWREALRAAARWHSPDPLCAERAAVVRALATGQVGW